MRHHLVVVVTSSYLMGLAGLLLPAGDLYARKTLQQCEAIGYALCQNGECADQYCAGSTVGLSGLRQPGSSACTVGTDGYTKCYSCGPGVEGEHSVEQVPSGEPSKK
jgi:hypothetical protein